MVHSSCRSICHSSEPQVPLYVSSVPDQHPWDIVALNIDWSGLTGYAYPPTTLLHRVIQKNQANPLPHYCNNPRLAMDALVLGPNAALNADPTPISCVNDTPQTVPQPNVSQQSTVAQPSHLLSRSGQLQEQIFSVKVAERIAAPQRLSTRTIYQSKWSLFERWCRENLVDFSSPTVKQISDFFMYLYQDLNRRPSTIDGYRMAIVDALGPVGLQIS